MLPFLLVAAGLAGAAAAFKNPRTSLEWNARQQVAAHAAGEVNKTDPRPYVEDALGHPSDWDRNWCGMFALWAYHQAGLLLDVHWKTDGSGFVGGNLRPIVPSQLQAGDLIYFDQPYQHHALVEWVNHATGMMSTINGNGAGGAVTRVVRPIADADNYYSMGHLVAPGPGLARAA
ncbi:MAG TPA: hypothetical protein VMY40_15000 [Anaerolineae bacterium]|nr:hypothetical protein [Anaerolineae bacterium]